MSVQSNTGIRPVGPYHPYRGAFPVTPPAPTTPSYPGSPSGGGVKDFFQDVWVGGKEQIGSNVGKALNPIRTTKNAWQMIKNPGQALSQLAAPYRQDLASGDPGKAVGRLLANVATIGGIVLGGRALLGRFGGGGASVGMRGPVGAAFDAVSGFVGGITRSVGKVFTGALGVVGNGVRWLIGGGGGASIGFR